MHALKKLASTTSGAVFKILRTFYIQAIQSIIDFSALSLLELSPNEFEQLECIQNEVMRTILGAPRWTRLDNLRTKCNLVSLQLRIQQLTASYMAKTLISDKPFVYKNRILPQLARPAPNIFIDSWHTKTAHAIKADGIGFSIVHAGPDSMNPNYTPPLPWENIPFNCETTLLPTKKAPCPQTVLDEISTKFNNNIEPNNLQLFTDGSMDTDSGHSGSAVYSSHYTESWRLSDNCSTLQSYSLSNRLYPLP